MQPSASRQVTPEERSGSLTRLLREVDPHVLDALAALGLTVVAIAIMIGRTTGEEFRGDDLLGAGLVMVQTLPLAVRRVSPLGVVIAISVALVAHSAAGYQVVEAGTFSSLVSVYGAASLTDSRGGIFAAAVTVVGIAGVFATNRGDFNLVDVAATTGTWAVAWVAGTFVRVRGEQVEVAGARAARLELERETLARDAVADERARMARELHDIVGHALNVIVIQAAAARRVFDARPDVPRDALASIESTGRDALFDMERMLGVLSVAEGGEGASGPQPSLAELDGLAGHVTEAGIPVEVIVEGSRQEIPASVELSAYRIVQESLTNCLKHSRASHATVTVRYRPDDLEVEVVDDGRGSAGNRAGDREGRGHVGMRERVALFGGEISIGPQVSGGYRVWARLPFKSSPA